MKLKSKLFTLSLLQQCPISTHPSHVVKSWQCHDIDKIMKCLKVEEYIKRTACLKETCLLHEDLEIYVNGGPGPQGRTLCDRVIRACNQQLGVGALNEDHTTSLIKLVELALHGYDVSGEFGTQSSPLYMEKIIFHILKKLASLGIQTPCSHLGSLLYQRLASSPQTEDYCVLVRSCFAVLWNGLSGPQAPQSPRDKLHCQMQALSFLLLLDGESTSSPACSKAPVYTEDALAEFEKGCGTLTELDASFLLQETLSYLMTSWTEARGGEGDGGPLRRPCLPTLFEVVLITTKLLCKAGYWALALRLIDEAQGRVRDCSSNPDTAIVLGRWAVDIHQSLSTGRNECGQGFTECARTLRSLPAALGEREGHAVLEGCSLIMWAVETGQSKGLSGAVLLSWFSFLEEQQELMLKRLQRKEASQSQENRLQQSLCFSMYQGFVFTYESMLALQLENTAILDRVLLYCQATAGQMMTELRKLPSDSILIKAVTAMSNLVCGLYNRQLYNQAFTLVEILCQELCKNCPASLSVDRLNRVFMLAVQSSRRGGQLERALDWVILWMQVLGERVTEHMTEPVSLWVKTKADAARAGQEDTRLRTLRDGFGTDVPAEGVMLCLLEEELRAYRDAAGDTTQERYNTLCDLLDICHEDSTHTHLRAVYLCDMARVVCFQDFSEQTDCSAVDFTHEALRLLEEEPETVENADRLKDDKAHACLWLYICTLEKNLQEAIEKEGKLRNVHEHTEGDTNPVPTNDLDYEDKQKQQDSHLVYEGLRFNLAAESKRHQPLDRALGEWCSLLKNQKVPSVRNPKQTCTSIALTAALYKLMGKTLQALEAYQLAIGLSRALGDAHGCATSLCHSARLLLELGAPELGQAQLEQAEQCLGPDPPTEGPLLPVMIALLRAQLCYSTGQVTRGVPYLCEVLREVGEQRRSKSWYLLHARALQTCSAYLSLDTGTLPQALRQHITDHGLKGPDVALYESLKLLCSLLVTLVGNGMYGAYSTSADNHFIDQGDNLIVKWQLLSELLACSVRLVSVRSSSGAVAEAKLQCLEALKLATKLQTLSQCAELLVVKAELELMRGEREESGFDLDKVRNLLELCTDFTNQEQKTDVKIKPRKGRPVQKPESPLLSAEEDCKGFLSTRWFPKEPVERDQASSPPLKARPRRWLSSLSHEADCQCPCCSDPSLGRVTARWAATHADLSIQLGLAEARTSRKLHVATLARCKAVTAKLGARLAKLIPLPTSSKAPCRPTLLQDLMGRVYLCMALYGLDLHWEKAQGTWKVLDAGHAFLTSKPSPELGPLRAGMLGAKALASCLALAAQSNCPLEELFSSAWIWNPPEEPVEQDTKHKTMPPPVSAKKTKDPAITAKIKDTKKAKDSVPKIKVSLSTRTTKAKILVPKTPVVLKPSRTKSSVGVLSSFDFDTEVPMVACTPVQRVKAQASVRAGTAKTSLKLPFHVYEEESPAEDQPQPVPAAPKRTKKSRFKVEFSDESDPEAEPHVEVKEKAKISKKRPTSTRTARVPKAVPETPGEKVPARRPARGKKSKELSLSCTSEEEGVVVVAPAAPAAARRARPRRQQAGAGAVDEPEKMRTIEEIEGTLDSSIDELKASDTETEESIASDMVLDILDTDFEVLRRDLCADKERDFPFAHRNGGHPMGTLPAHLPHSNHGPDDLSIEAVQSLLRTAWLALQHFPPPTLYPHLCALLALSLGQQDPVTTAMLHAQSVGVTSRHQMIRHLANRLKKLKKSSSELADKLSSLSLQESSVQTGTDLEQRLAQLENIYTFSTADSSAFPQQHCHTFTSQIQELPTGVTVCMLSVLGVQPGQIGDTVLLSRLEKGSAPVTVRIPTAQRQHPVSWLVQEMDSIQKEQKAVSCVSEKAKWWEGRRALDARVERLLEEMEGLLVCWRGLLLPLTSDPQLSTVSQRIHKSLSQMGVKITKEMLKAVLSASPLLTQRDLRLLAQGVCPERGEECVVLLQTAVSDLAERTEPKGHVVLILDKYLQKLPWESISCLRPRSVTRMPSLHSLLGHCALKESDPSCVLNRGVDTKQVYYVLNPEGNLGDTEERFKDWFNSEVEWQGMCGGPPNSDQLQEVVTTKDLYIYVGHGAGARFLDGQRILKQELRAACLLFGCSSAALAVRGELEGSGIILNYLMAGCPFVLGNLWDVTDRDIDRFTKALLESWLSAGSGAPLLDYMAPSRQATHLKYLIGAAPIVYGLPIHME